MNRIDRLVAILLQLQSTRRVKAKDIAEKFSLSLRTVYRDIKALEEAGVPVIGEIQINGPNRSIKISVVVPVDLNLRSYSRRLETDLKVAGPIEV